MSLNPTPRPTWLTFDCYGTLIQWDEGLQAAVSTILRGKDVPADGDVQAQLIGLYDEHEHALEKSVPHRSFRSVAGQGLQMALNALGLPNDDSDIRTLTDNISAMPPFPEVVETLRLLKQAGFKLCIISNTDDDIIAGNVAQLGGHIDRVISAQQAQAYKPSRRIFEHAWSRLGVGKDEVVHICASPHLDHAAARELGFRCVWIDRGTGRQTLPDYRPDATLATLDQVPRLFATLGWMAQPE
ncbi:haloacid dehalogenase type II [Janthinobacterium agaricidamnosum]|uniref:Haloacid dehalogenase, type II n=1 Tax=Janthinobacterium agaricidamnosum NBRC 102515 = DSM 9628 TaxID=1349767 RepID=W0VDL4_9BURK|nr:haloacid dehalogenase type II [Janthinobacterium agaricidamnosum]CDG86001.1 haloacid dehalogenase, type II [Janthinobacterium agaricidamnosum NBRC 102515 = DSM 9628]